MRPEMLVAAFATRIAHTQEAAKSWYADATSNDAERQKGAIDTLNRKLADLTYAMYGEDELASKSVRKKADEIRKNFDSLYAPSSVTAVRFDKLSDMLKVDLKWMPFFQMVPAFGSREVELETVTNIVTHDEYYDGEDIKSKPLAYLSNEKFGRKRYGGATSFLRLWSETNGVITLARIIQAHQTASLVKRSNVAYTLLGNTSGVSVETFDTSIIKTVNKAANNLIESLVADKYNLTDDAGLLLLTNSANKDAVNAAFRTIQGENGTNILLEYNVQPVFTRNLAIVSDLGLGNGAAGMLILPGQANIWSDFDPARVERVRNVRGDSEDLVYQEYYNARVAGIQKRVVEFVA